MIVPAYTFARLFSRDNGSYFVIFMTRYYVTLFLIVFSIFNLWQQNIDDINQGKIEYGGYPFLVDLHIWLILLAIFVPFCICFLYKNNAIIRKPASIERSLKQAIECGLINEIETILLFDYQKFDINDKKTLQYIENCCIQACALRDSTSANLHNINNVVNNNTTSNYNNINVFVKDDDMNKSSVELLKFWLLETGIVGIKDINMKSYFGDTVLMHAIRNQNEEMVQFLVDLDIKYNKCKVNLNVQNNNGMTCLMHVVSLTGQQNLLEIIFKSKLYIDLISWITKEILF